MSPGVNKDRVKAMVLSPQAHLWIYRYITEETLRLIWMTARHHANNPGGVSLAYWFSRGVFEELQTLSSCHFSCFHLIWCNSLAMTNLSEAWRVLVKVKAAPMIYGRLTVERGLTSRTKQPVHTNTAWLRDLTSHCGRPGGMGLWHAFNIP